MSVEEIDKESIKILNELFRRAERRILMLMQLEGALPADKNINAITAINARRRIAEVIDELSLEASTLLNEGAVQVFETTVRQNLEALPVDFTTDSAQAVSNVFKESIRDIPSIFGRAKQELRRGIIAATILGEPLDETVEKVAKTLKITQDQSTVLTSTTLLSTEAAGSVVLAEETGVPMVYIYSGPSDGKTRAFCEFYGFEQGPKVAYTREALKALSRDPNQRKQPGGRTKDTAFFRGGFNCRHTWAPRPLVIAESEGYRILDAEDVNELIRKGGSTR